MDKELRIKMIEHLSREVQTLTKALMTWRTKVNFPIFIAPMVILGLALFGDPKNIENFYFQGVLSDIWLYLSIVIFIVYGFVCGCVELHFMGQCNSYRVIIAKLSAGDDNLKLAEKESFKFKAHIQEWYVFVYVLIALQTACLLMLANRILIPSTGA